LSNSASIFWPSCAGYHTFFTYQGHQSSPTNSALLSYKELVMKILIALDGSANSNEFPRHLAYFPLTGDTSVHILVVHDDSILAPRKIDKVQGQKIIEDAERVIRSAFPAISISSELRSGSAQTQILQVSDTLCPDLILAGAHSPRPLPGALLGSVAAHIAKHADCSVKLLRPGINNNNNNRVIACLENTEMDRTIAQAINKMHWPDHSVLMLLHVLDSPPVEFSQNPKEDARMYYSLQAKQKNEMLTSMENHITEIKKVNPTLEIETHLSEELAPVEVILALAKSWSADTILIGSHRREGLERFWLGSVSEPVSAGAHCSVHIMRHSAKRQN
jgi:nucleotide-binding universal stress UspA family protein